MEEEDDQRELQLLLPEATMNNPSHLISDPSINAGPSQPPPPPPLDLQLSIGPQMLPPSTTPPVAVAEEIKTETISRIKKIKRHAADQIRLAAMEKAYAERVRELTRREMELAESEFAQAKQMWERAQADVERARRLKERATRRLDSTCMEITCQACFQRFRA